jgi:hypothetical protein
VKVSSSHPIPGCSCGSIDGALRALGSGPIDFGVAV